MQAKVQKKHTGNGGLFIIASVIYAGLLILFLYQTWSFVNWLFPDDQSLMKMLTVLCFDVMALVWAIIDLFYMAASKASKTLVRWAWAISFIQSLLASIFYLVISSMFRFQITITPVYVNTGYGIVIFALTLQILFLTFWLYIEWNTRHPHQDAYLVDTEPLIEESASFAQTGDLVNPVENMSHSDIVEKNLNARIAELEKQLAAKNK